ncbi:MAG: peptidase E [Candidatus Dormiibacterota bacterium]
MTKKTGRILATSGGFVESGVQMQMRLGGLTLRGLELTGSSRPRVCLVNTADGDGDMYYALSYEAFNAAGCDVTQLRLFPQPSANPEERLCGSDFVWVGGGSVANLLALWALHGVGDAMRAAWEKGVVLGGVSAGSVCWHIGGTTDSFSDDLDPVTNGLAFLPYGNGVHYDAQPKRRPRMHELMLDGTLPELAYCTDNGFGILYEGTDPVEVVADRKDSDPERGAYVVRRGDAGIAETKLSVGPIKL